MRDNSPYFPTKEEAAIVYSDLSKCRGNSLDSIYFIRYYGNLPG